MAPYTPVLHLTTPTCLSRSKNDIAMPMTARVSGVAKTRASDTGGSLTGRKTGVYKQGASSTAPLSSRQQGVFATGTSSRWK